MPLQYDLRCRAAKDHSLMRAAAAARNLDAATAARENTMFHTPASSPNTRPMQHSRRHYNVFCSIMCALMQPLQFCNRTLQNTIMEEPIMSKRTARNRLTHDCSHFIEKTKFRSPASSPTQVPCNIPAAILHHFPELSHFSESLLP